MNFNSKETYLAAVSEWKAEYKQLSSDIIQAKTDLREADRIMQKSKGADYSAAWRKLEALRSELMSLKQQATSMIQDRHDSKIESAKQFVANKQAIAA